MDNLQLNNEDEEEGWRERYNVVKQKYVELECQNRNRLNESMQNSIQFEKFKADYQSLLKAEKDKVDNMQKTINNLLQKINQILPGQDFKSADDLLGKFDGAIKQQQTQPSLESAINTLVLITQKAESRNLHQFENDNVPRDINSLVNIAEQIFNKLISKTQQSELDTTRQKDNEQSLKELLQKEKEFEGKVKLLLQYPEQHEVSKQDQLDKISEILKQNEQMKQKLLLQTQENQNQVDKILAEKENVQNILKQYKNQQEIDKNEIDQEVTKKNKEINDLKRQLQILQDKQKEIDKDIKQQQSQGTNQQQQVDLLQVQKNKLVRALTSQGETVRQLVAAWEKATGEHQAMQEDRFGALVDEVRKLGADTAKNAEAIRQGKQSLAATQQKVVGFFGDQARAHEDRGDLHARQIQARVDEIHNLQEEQHRQNTDYLKQIQESKNCQKYLYSYNQLAKQYEKQIIKYDQQIENLKLQMTNILGSDQMQESALTNSQTHFQFQYLDSCNLQLIHLDQQNMCNQIQNSTKCVQKMIIENDFNSNQVQTLIQQINSNLLTNIRSKYPNTQVELQKKPQMSYQLQNSQILISCLNQNNTQFIASLESKISDAQGQIKNLDQLCKDNNKLRLQLSRLIKLLQQQQIDFNIAQQNKLILEVQQQLGKW